MYNILMIAPTPFFADRGCHVRIYEQTRSLQKLGNQVNICTYHNGKNIAGLSIYRIINIPWYKKLEPGPSYHKFYLDFLLLLKSFFIARILKPDIIHGHLHEGAAIGYVVSKILRIPLLFDHQGSLTAELKAHNFLSGYGLYFRILYKAEKIIDNLATIVVAPTTDMLRKLREKFSVRNIYLMSDGVDTDNFKPGIASDGLRKKLRLPLNKKIVVYLGILAEYQGVDCLLKAIPEVVQKVNNVHFLIMGYPNLDKYRKIAEKLEIVNNVTFAGRIDYGSAAEYLNIGDIAVAPKLGEAEADGKVYNYMACGLPVIASDIQVHREILGDTAIFAEVNNSASLAKAMVKSLLNEELAQELSIKVRQRAVENFSWDSRAKKLEKIYKIAISNSSRRKKWNM